MVTTLDKFGRVIIPKKLRERLGIDLRTTLNISEDGKKIVIEPIEEKEPIIDKNGILVFIGNLNEKADNLIKADRNKRSNKLLKGDC